MLPQLPAGTAGNGDHSVRMVAHPEVIHFAFVGFSTDNRATALGECDISAKVMPGIATDNVTYRDLQELVGATSRNERK